MTKSLNDILKRYSDALSGKRELKTSALTTGDNPGVDYADKMKDTRDFIAQHSVEKFDDRVGNGDDVYNASKVQKAKMERHGHEPKPKDINVYKKNQQVGQPENKLKEETEQLDEVKWNYTEVDPKMVKSVIAAHRATGNAARHMGGGRIAHTGKLSKPDIEASSVKESKDDREYGYEGDMAITQLKTICRHGEHLIKMLKPDTDLPEWVQAKITKAEDYISTAHDYLMSEMNEEVEELDETTHRVHAVSKEGEAFKSGLKTKKEADSLHWKMAKTNKWKTIKIVKEEVEKLDESNYRKAVHAAFNGDEDAFHKHMGVTDDMQKSHPTYQNSKKKYKQLKSMPDNTPIGDAVKKLEEKVKSLAEAKCNMTEAGKMCEVHGNKACPKEDSAADKEPRYGGKKKQGKQLITDKKIQEMAASQNQAIAARIALKHKKEGTMPPKGTASHSMMGMNKKQLKDYTKTEPGAPKKVEESISNQRSSRSTASEKAREKMMNAIERRKMLKMKEQAAPAETVIKMPSGAVGDTGRV